MAFLKSQSSDKWLKAVMDNFEQFLVDHAAAEKKASGMALSMVSHYPDKPELVKVMTDIAIEELIHFKQVIKIMQDRDIKLLPDEKDQYIHQLRQQFRKGTNYYFLDRLIIGAIVEARGHERFNLIAKALSDPKLKQFYQGITKSEFKHYEIFINLAKLYFDEEQVYKRTDELLNIEALILENLPIKAALH